MEFYMEELCSQQHIPMNLVVHHKNAVYKVYSKNSLGNHGILHGGIV